ncbi:ATP-dependent DNA helicase RRM3-like [Bidens hawaiensis]|uniref:ATP-dependent DNA helicase RRM3-like n=1 Tax=Bidens hawaiensis TaxID=980011 RepID=UPI0040490EBB
MLIFAFMHPSNKIHNPQDVNKFISAEIPNKDTDPDLYKLVSDHMIHGPCGDANPNYTCMVNKKCSKGFPKMFNDETAVDSQGFPVYKSRDNGQYVVKSDIMMDNRTVVPYNKTLLKQFQTHINVEWYPNLDEIKAFYDCRYVSACEASWRIFSFDVHYRTPSVMRLAFHLPGEQQVIYGANEDIEDILNKPTIASSMFTGWFECNKKHDLAKTLTYAEFPTKYVWKKQLRKWEPRLRGFAIGRVHAVPPTFDEAYYLRILLNKVRGPECFEEIRTVDGVVCETFRDACYKRGLLDDDKEYIEAIEEASHTSTGYYLRNLFATMLITYSLSRPHFVWESTWQLLVDGIQYKQQKDQNNPGLILNEEQLKNLALLEIENFLISNNSSLRRYKQMPFPDMEKISRATNPLMVEELSYDTETMNNEFNNLFDSLTDEQRGVYNEIMSALIDKKGGVYFVYGYGGTGKTYLWKTLSASIRSKGEVVLNFAPRGIASLLLEGGRTAHSRFLIPILTEDSICPVKGNTDVYELLKKTSLIIWDEAPMIHNHAFEALDKTLNDVMNGDSANTSGAVFGGKVVIFGGDFRQILPVVTNDIGQGNVGGPNTGEAVIDIPDDLLILNSVDPMGDLIRFVYPNILDRFNELTYFQDRALLAPLNEVVQEINERILDLFPGEEVEYLSSDSLVESEDISEDFDPQLYSPDLLNGLKMSGMPNHRLVLKVGVPIMLLRNINHKKGLCNGTRLQVVSLDRRVIEEKVVSGMNIGYRTLISRVSLTPTDKKLPFKLKRRQFPISVCFAMTINKSQGQSLSRAGLYLKDPVFSHGQLYVALSRVKTRDGIKLVILDKESKLINKTTNVVYKEIFGNIEC